MTIYDLQEMANEHGVSLTLRVRGHGTPEWRPGIELIMRDPRAGHTIVREIDGRPEEIETTTVMRAIRAMRRDLRVRTTETRAIRAAERAADAT